MNNPSVFGGKIRIQDWHQILWIIDIHIPALSVPRPIRIPRTCGVMPSSFHQKRGRKNTITRQQSNQQTVTIEDNVGHFGTRLFRNVQAQCPGKASPGANTPLCHWRKMTGSWLREMDIADWLTIKQESKESEDPWQKIHNDGHHCVQSQVSKPRPSRPSAVQSSARNVHSTLACDAGGVYLNFFTHKKSPEMQACDKVTFTSHWSFWFRAQKKSF